MLSKAEFRNFSKILYIRKPSVEYKETTPHELKSNVAYEYTC